MDGRSQAFNVRRNRNSILQTAGDALGIRMNKRKRTSIRQPPVVVDDVVLEISAAKNNINYDYGTVQESVDDSTERERLRDAAAQAVGLPQTQALEDTTSLGAYGVEEQIASLPKYPATLSELQTLIHTSTTTSKYCPVTSPFLRLSRSKQWKTRHIALTTVRPRRELGGSQSHIHLFKTSAPHDREIERMIITQDSVVYIADEEFLGGRKFVIKVGGTTANASNPKRDEQSAASTWLLQMPDASQMQRWIQFIKSAVLMQMAEQAGVGPVLYQNTYNNVGPELKGDVDVILSMGKQGLFTTPSTVPIGNSYESAGVSNSADEVNTSVIQRHESTGSQTHAKAFFNGRPPSRHLSISGSSIATALASPTHHPSQGSLQNTIHEGEHSTQDGSSGKTTRDSTLFNMFRPTSPIQPAPLMNPLSPPLSPTLQHSQMDENVLSSPSTLTSRFSAPISPRHGHHSSTLSTDWDFVDGGSFPSVTTKRIMQVTQTALAPPPRKRPLTNGGLPTRQGSPPKDQSEAIRLSTPPAVVVRRSFDDDEAGLGSGDMIGQSSFTESSATGQDGQEDTGPELTNTTPLSELDQDNASFGRPIPSPMGQHDPPSLPSCSSSFGVDASSKTATLEQLINHASRSSTPSLHSEQHDHYTEEDTRPIEGDADYINHFHSPTGSLRKSRTSAIPRQSPPPLGPPPAIPMFHSPPFPAQSPSHDYSSSERPGSSSSIPSTVPSLHMGLSLTSKRISIMTTSDAPSVQSTESSGGASQSNRNPNSSFGSNRLSTSGQGSRAYAYPPPRPAPSQALPLPPAPLDDINSIGGKHRSSLSGRVRSISPSSNSGPSTRSEFMSKMVRLSMGPAAPPPTAALPPRPDTDDDFGYQPYPDVSRSPNSGVKPLFPIPGSPPRRVSSTLPAMQPPPLGPLPPTPGKMDGGRPVSPSQSVDSDHSTRSTPVVSASTRMSSLKARFRMKSQPTQPSSSVGNSLLYQGLPAAPPPPSVPPPAVPGDMDGLLSLRRQHIRGSTDSQIYSKMSGESTLHRRESSMGTYSGGLPSPTSPTMQAYSTLTGMRSSIPHPAAMPLSPPPRRMSPPPRRNSRASRDLTPQEKEKWRAVVENLDEDRPTMPYQSSAPVRHSAINLPDDNAFV